MDPAIENRWTPVSARLDHAPPIVVGILVRCFHRIDANRGQDRLPNRRGGGRLQGRMCDSSLAVEAHWLPSSHA